MSNPHPMARPVETEDARETEAAREQRIRAAIERLLRDGEAADGERAAYSNKPERK
jgi:hypothetical protein